MKSFFSSLIVLSSMTSALWSAERPNVVIIYGDDVGYNDVGAYGCELIPTPNIDRLAAEGLRFTDGHCSAATCTPSRFSMLTGVHGFRAGVRILGPDAPLCIPQDKITLPHLFKKAGYKTAVIGKWHLGIGQEGVKTNWNAAVKPGPLEIGFDYSFLLPSTNDRVPCVYLENHHVVNHDPNDPISIGAKPEDPRSTIYPDGRTNPEAMTYYPSTHGHNHSVINGIGRIGSMCGGKKALWDDETMADVFTEKTREYLSEQSKDEPFFLYFASQDIHVPRAPHPRFQGKTTLGHRGDAMVAFDWVTGEIMKALEDNGLRENTIIIFSSDNGPVYDDGYADGTVVKTSTEEVDQGHDGSGPFRGGKYQIYEGGTRVPFIVSWPKGIKPGVSDAMMNQIDFLASFAHFFEIDLEDHQAPDSRNMIDSLLGKSTEGLPFMIEEARGTALRKGDWKYIAPTRRKGETLGPELYNLKDDQGEQTDLSQSNPEMLESMKAFHDSILASEGVRFVKE